ncbi:hypothetical protein O5190_27115, partial [Escherichia coli]|nr:hypothetical protein [Escherichia coli]
MLKILTYYVYAPVFPRCPALSVILIALIPVPLRLPVQLHQYGLELGQPMHAFDKDRIEGGIVVR